MLKHYLHLYFKKFKIQFCDQQEKEISIGMQTSTNIVICYLPISTKSIIRTLDICNVCKYYKHCIISIRNLLLKVGSRVLCLMQLFSQNSVTSSWCLLLGKSQKNYLYKSDKSENENCRPMWTNVIYVDITLRINHCIRICCYSVVFVIHWCNVAF